MIKPIILATNIENLKKGQSAKDSEISVGILPADLTKEEPILYAYRQGMVYHPKNDFRPDVSGGHSLPEKLRAPYYELLEEARENLKKFKKDYLTNGPSNSGEIDELRKVINQKEARIIEQADKINELSKKGPSNSGQLNQLETMIRTLSDVQSHRIEIKIGDKATKIIEKVVHENFKKILTLLSEEEAVYMYGPSGTGKSQLAKDIADALELDFYPASTVTQEFKLTGYKDASGTYHETNFYKAMKYGGVFFLDEMDSCAPDVLVGINGALANGYFDFPNGTLYAHENFRVIAAGNTIGRGGNEQFTGRFALDMSTLDRFLGVEVNYSTIIDNAVAQGNKELVEFAQAARKAAEENGIIIIVSYRAISKIVKLEGLEFDLSEIMNMAIIKGMASDDIRMLTRNMTIERTNKYYKALREAA